MTIATRAPLANPRTVFAPPADLTAPEPPEHRGLRRDGVRLLVADARGVRHTRFDRLTEHLHAGDVLVVNTSATMPGQLDGRRGVDPVVVHVANRLPDRTRVVELRSAPRAAEPLLDGGVGEVIQLAAGGHVELLAEYPRPGSSPRGTGSRLWRGRVTVEGSLSAFLGRHGRPISYGSWTTHTRSRAIRRSSPCTPAAQRCPAPAGRSARSSQPGWWRTEW